MMNSKLWGLKSAILLGRKGAGVVLAGEFHQRKKDGQITRDRRFYGSRGQFLCHRPFPGRASLGSSAAAGKITRSPS